MSPPNQKSKLRILKLLFDACVLVWIRRRLFVRALWLPLVLIVALTYVWAFSGRTAPTIFQWAVLAAYYLLFTQFAVNCHRVVLLPSPTAIGGRLPQWGRRESYFMLWLTFIWVFAFACAFISTNIYVVIFGNLGDLFRSDAKAASLVLAPTQYIYYLTYAYVFARLSLILPAVSIDEKLNFQGAVKLSLGQGWRLAIVAIVVPLAYKSIGLIFDSFDFNVWTYIVQVVLTTTLLAVQVTTLSLAYRELTTAE